MQSIYDRIQYYKMGQKRKASLIAKLKSVFANEERIRSAWLFGSFTRRNLVRDIDLAIYAEPELTFKEYLSLNAQIELEVGVPVGLVDISKAPATLREVILKDGVKIK